MSRASEELATKPIATIALLAIPAILYIVLRATGSVRGVVVVEATQTFTEIFNATFGDDPWRYLVAPFFFVNAGYLFICGVGIADLRPAARAPPRLAPDASSWASPAAPWASSPRTG